MEPITFTLIVGGAIAGGILTKIFGASSKAETGMSIDEISLLVTVIGIIIGVCTTLWVNDWGKRKSRKSRKS